jgi:Terminase RNaseH-like domain
MFKDLQKLVQQSEQQQRNANNQIFEILRNKPFWIWDKEGHKQEDINTKGDCCFNHIIGLPIKEKLEKPLFDYEKLLYDSLLVNDYSSNVLNHTFKHKHLWVKKSTGLGVTEFFLRLMTWLSLRNNDYQNSQMCIVTGPNIDIAIKLIKRMKGLFEPKLDVTFDSKETVIELNGCSIEAYPSNHIDAYRALENPKFILLDEADFFRKGEQEDVRHVSERYIAKSDPYIVMVSTPNGPDGLFERIEKEPEETCIYKRLLLDYTYGLDKIYTREEIQKAKASPSFEREYNLKYLGGIGNVFSPADIDAALQEYDIVQQQYGPTQYPYLQGIMGLDPGWGTSSFGIVIVYFVDGLIRVAYVDEYSRSDHSEMLEVVWQLIERYNVTKVLVDASAPSFIRALKLQLGERSDYENVEKEMRDYMKVEPVSFGVEHKQLLYHVKFLLENKYLQIHPSMDKLIIALRTSWAKDGVLDKEVTSHNDILDAFRLALRPFKEQSIME